MIRTHAFKDRVREQRGAAAVEFAIVAVLLFMVLFGIVVWGQVFSELEVLNGAAREGARLAAVGDPVNSRVSAIQQRVVDTAKPYTLTASPSVTVKTAGGASVSQDPPCQNTTGVGSTDTSQGQVSVSWVQRIPINIPFMPSIQRDVTISAVFTCE